MASHPRRTLLCAALLLPGTLCAQWATDPMLNLAIADRPSEQVIPKVAATSDGGCYVGWFDHASGNYDVYLQRLDAAGNELWPHNGILVSSHPSASFLVDWTLIVDGQDHCVLTFCDTRNGGGDFDVFAYRVAPDGSPVWGTNGVTLSAVVGFEAAPRVAELSNGDFVFCWSRDGAGIVAQVVSPAGSSQYPAGGTIIAGLPGESPGFCEVVATDTGSFIVAWVRDISSFLSPRHIHAQKFSAAGTPQWAGGPVAVHDSSSVPVAHAPTPIADGAGGAVIVWHASPVSIFNTHVQRLDASGQEQFPHGGVTVSTDATRHHLDPTATYLPASQEILIFFNERNGAQSQWGIYGQKFDATGQRQWTATGRQLLPVDGIWKGPPRCLASGTGALVFVLDQPTGVMGQERVLGMRVDAAGMAVWPGQPLAVSSRLSGKSRLPVAATPQGAALVVWEDERTDAADIYGQRVADDGTLGGGGGTPLPQFVRGDCNDDASHDIADAVFLLGFLFPAPGSSTILACQDGCDANDDGNLDIADAIRLLAGLFGSPPAPPAAPHPDCGLDPTAGDPLDCGGSVSCP